jgi:hypothetical protein
MIAGIIVIEVPKDVSAQVTEEWVARYSGPGLGVDEPRDMVLDEITGNIYVTGRSASMGGENNYDYATVAYDSDGNELWISRYNGPGDGGDVANAITTDSSGKVYVTGRSVGTTSRDIATIAYDSNGNELWVSRYNGAGDNADDARAIAVDKSSGNIYVAGKSIKIQDNTDFITIAYDSSGNLLWEALYNGPGDDYDCAEAIAIDIHRNIYVTGVSFGGKFYNDGTEDDYVTIAYDSNGNQLWVVRYNEPVNSDDKPRAMTVDSYGNVYVTGSSVGNGTKSDFLTISYDPDGNQIWTGRYNAANDGDWANAITMDPFGNVIVTGHSYIGQFSDYCTIKYDFAGNELWRTRYNGPANANDYPYGIVVDIYGNIYVTGKSYGVTPSTAEHSDYTTVAYDSNGNQLWVIRYNGPGNGRDDACAIAINPNGDIYVTGESRGIDTDTDYATVKYSQTSTNQPPIVDAGPDQTVNESDVVHFDGNGSYDPDGTIDTYEWDFDASDGLGWNTGVPPDATNPTSNHKYGDDGVFIATLRVMDDQGLSNTDTCIITVQNIDPEVIIESTIMDVEIGLRVAGRKYNDVGMALYEDGNPIGYISIERMPGSPNDQMVWIPVSIDYSKSYNATVTYTPEDPPNVGGNPVWIYIKSQNGSIKNIHHTFNVQQSKKRDSEHWNHVEPWEVDLNAHYIGLPFEIVSHITDPGSDDETLTYTYGSQIVNVTYMNNPPNPDPYPSPEVNPVDIYNISTLVYEGPGTVMLVVEDDDGGTVITTIVI